MIQQIKYGVVMAPVIGLCIWLFLVQLAEHGW